MEKQFNLSGIFSQDFPHCRFFEIQKDLRKRYIEPENFTDPLIFTSMFNDIEWTRKGNDGICISNLQKGKTCAKICSQGHWTFLSPGGEKKWYGTLLCTPEGTWDPNGEAIQRYRSSSIQEYQRFESWDLEKINNGDTTLINADASDTETEQFRASVNNSV